VYSVCCTVATAVSELGCGKTGIEKEFASANGTTLRGASVRAAGAQMWWFGRSRLLEEEADSVCSI
jgi:hypothetical protein